MHEYREALYRMRRGERDRQMARDGVMGRHKLARLRSVAEQEGWLDVARALPAEAQILQVRIPRDPGHCSAVMADSIPP